MTPKIRSVGRGPAGRRYLSSERELWLLGVCFWFRLFNVAPETTARFSYLDNRSRSQSPPCLGYPATLTRSLQSTTARNEHKRQPREITYASAQRPISLVARAASRSSSRVMMTLRLS